MRAVFVFAARQDCCCDPSVFYSVILLYSIVCGHLLWVQIWDKQSDVHAIMMCVYCLCDWICTHVHDLDVL